LIGGVKKVETNVTPSAMPLGGDERVIYYGKRCWESLLGKLISGIIGIVLFFIFFALFQFLWPIWILFILLPGISAILGVILERIRTEYVFTNLRVYDKYGIIARREKEVEYNKITDTSFDQSIWGRFLDYGTVHINTAGRSGYEISFVGVKNPQHVNNILRNSLKGREIIDRRKQRLERMKDKFYTGEITAAQFEEAKKKILAEKDFED
jgi:uncharacterized membrane protein YdbT with pleckstrin-like domain